MSFKWSEIPWYSKLMAVVIVGLVVYIVFDVVKDNENGDDNITSEESEQVDTAEQTAISIANKNIDEENFKGKIPIITGSGVLAEEARKFIDATLGEFRVQANAEVPEIHEKFEGDVPPIEYEIDIEAKYAKSEKTESVIVSIYQYTGGANGNSSYHVITVSEGRLLTLSKLIRKDRQEEFIKLVKKELTNWRPEGSEASVVFSEEVNNLQFASLLNWSTDDKNLILYFDKYQIGPGVLGAVAFPISLNKIEAFLEPSFFANE